MLRQVAGDGVLQVVRRTETEGAGIADIELDQGAALGLEFAGAAGEFAADLVTDFGQAFAGDDSVLGHVLMNGENPAQSLPESHGVAANPVTPGSASARGIVYRA